VGGHACAPVRCAHPSFWVHRHAKRGAVRPPPIAASLLLIRSLKPANRSFADPSDDILWSKLCTGATICSTFFRFILLKIVFDLVFLLYSSYSYLLISSYSSRTILPLLILLFFRNCDTHTHTHTQTKYPR
jgi:hypothetical protein